MTKPVLPPCSVEGCERAAGAIIDDALLCGQHAVIEFDKILRAREEAMLREKSSIKKDAAN